MDTLTLNGNLFSIMLKNGSGYLRENRTVVNELNVFPVPDGDTGDNMYMTAQAGCDALTSCKSDVKMNSSDGVKDIKDNNSEAIPLDRIAAAAAEGMLRGARGNSGVILSRIFSGIADGFSGSEYADVRLVGNAFLKGVQKAYSAVSVPVEGTILTVYREAAVYASGRLDSESTLISYFEDFTSELRRSLDRTPELLAVLREAGVVDSGGAGLWYIAEGMKHALTGGKSFGGEISITGGKDDESCADMPLSLLPECKPEPDWGYCTEFLLQLLPYKTDILAFDTENFVHWLNTAGESVVAFRDGNVVKVHVHTTSPETVLTYARQYGEFLKLKTENMNTQQSKAEIRNRFSEPEPKMIHTKHKKYAFISVAAGDGIKNTFIGIGADSVVDGGQCMNPSVDDILNAIDSLDADNIIILPNNGNIKLTANQAAELYESSHKESIKHIAVFPCSTLGEGYAALSMADTSAPDIDTLIEGMKEGAAGVVTGMVSNASRDATVGGIHVKQNDFIGYAGDVIYAGSPERSDALYTLAAKLDAHTRDVIILLCGSSVPDSEADTVYNTMKQKYNNSEVIMLNGGQPIYDWIIILE